MPFAPCRVRPCTSLGSLHAVAAWPSGSGKGLQSPLQRFNSARRLHRLRRVPEPKGSGTLCLPERRLLPTRRGRRIRRPLEEVASRSWPNGAADCYRPECYASIETGSRDCRTVNQQSQLTVRSQLNGRSAEAAVWWKIGNDGITHPHFGEMQCGTDPHNTFVFVYSTSAHRESGLDCIVIGWEHHGETRAPHT
jgi:hypothetical protein